MSDPDEARKLARQYLAAVGRSKAPSEGRHRSNQALALTEFADRYILEYDLGKKKPRSAESDRRMPMTSTSSRRSAASDSWRASS